MKSLQLILGIFLISMCSACAGRVGVKMGEIPPASIPTGEQKQIAEAFVETEISQEGRAKVKVPALKKRVQNIVNRITDAANYPRGTFPIHLIDAGDESNAMVINGASIVIYKELVSRVNSDAELAVVLSHEIGHVLGKHAEENEELESRQNSVSIGSSILGTIASVAASAAGLGGAGLIGDATEATTGMIGYGAFVGSFDRSQEYEADQIGLMLLAKAGYDPRTAVTFWSRSDEVFGSSDSQVGAFFSTHPAAVDRIDALEEAMPLALNYYEIAKKNPALIERSPAAHKSKNVTKNKS